jgi:two-component system sensor histidine kinase KdpD
MVKIRREAFASFLYLYTLIYNATVYTLATSFIQLILHHKISRPKQYLYSISLICAVALCCFLLSNYVGFEVAAFCLLLTLSFIAMLFDIMPVLVSATLSALLWDFLFLHPRFNIQVGNTEDRIMLSMYFVIALLNAVLTYKIRQLENIARQKEEKAQAIKLYNTFLNSLSHEFRTPLATIIGTTDLLLQENNEADKQHLLNDVSIASLRLNQLVENLLNMSRLESGFLQLKKEWCDVKDMIHVTLKKLHGTLTDHSIQTNIASEVPMVKVDHVLIEQALYNIIHNATIYTPASSVISIHAAYADNNLSIIIADNGAGFPPDEINKVFDKFYRINNLIPGGTGLGLSIARGFIEAHNGNIELHNNNNGGATFTITIPVETYA